MRRLLVTITLAAALVPTGTAGAVKYKSFHSDAMRGTMHYSVALPGGYGSSGKRYPVVYFLHGLPATSHAYRGIGWLVQALRQDGMQAIVVGAQGVRGNDP